MSQSILDKIISTKHQEVTHFLATTDMDKLKEAAAAYTPKGFTKALMTHAQEGRIGVISEIKKASPSKGIICENFDPVTIAHGYQRAGASCLSILTDRDYFLGHEDYLMAVRAVCDLPILRKDFMVHDSQIIHAKAMGADCILLIMACLNDEEVAALHACAISLGLDVLIEIHSEEELVRALALPYSPHNLYGINNRDLNTFEVSLNNSIRLGAILKEKLGTDALIVSESGIHSAEDIHLLQSHDIEHFLIGEQFMKTADAGAALATLLKAVKAR